MDSTGKSNDTINAAFGISDERIAELKAQAQQSVSRDIDEVALLEQFKKEALERATAALKEQAEAEVSESNANEGRGLPDAHGFSKKRFRIFIHESQNASDPKEQPVSINGYAWNIKRGVDVLVPPEVVHVLENAITEVVVQAEGGLITRPAHRIPFQNYGEATAADLAKFEQVKRTAGVQPQ
jgi:hypothetical protein